MITYIENIYSGGYDILGKKNHWELREPKFQIKACE